MNWVDYCILAVTLLSVIVGVMRGFTREVFSLLTWVLAIGITLAFGEKMTDYLAPTISIPALRIVAGYAVCFLGGLLSGALISVLFTEMVANSRLAPADKTLGMGFGVLRALLVVAVFIMIADNMGARKEPWWQASMLIGKVEWVASGVQAVVPESWLVAIRPQNTDPSTEPAKPADPKPNLNPEQG